MSSLVWQTILRQEYPEAISLEKKTTTALPGRAALTYAQLRQAGPPTDIIAEPCPRLRKALRRAGVHAPSRPKTGLGADIGSLKMVLHAVTGQSVSPVRSSRIVS